MDLCKRIAKSNMLNFGFGIICGAPKSNAFDGDLSLKITALALLYQHLQITIRLMKNNVLQWLGSTTPCNLMINLGCTLCGKWYVLRQEG